MAHPPANADAPDRFMRRALELAELGRGWVEPNPVVGCVLVREGRIIGEGYHRQFGGDHAEVEALASCDNPAGATAYVTLEPCSHHGKTPPCAQALIDAKVGHAIVAMIDPDPRVAGRGIAALQAAGIDVTVGPGEAEAAQLNEAFIKRVTTGRPWVTAKWAQTLDGKTATATGDSKWISNEPSRRVVHELRARVDAIIVGIGTALADDPALTARGVEVRRIARRVVVDRDRRLPPTAKLMADAGPPVTIATSEANAHAEDAAALPDHIELLPLPTLDTGRLDLAPLMRHLADEHAATHVLAEGGAGLTGALLAQGLVDRALAFIAPKLLGDASAVPSYRGGPCETIARAQPLRLIDVQRLEDDVLLDYRVGTPADPQ